MTLSNSWRSELDPERVMRTNVIRWQEGDCYKREDHLAVEEPFEVRIEHNSIATIMRTPGHDFELALGFLFSEGVIQDASDVLSLEQELDPDGLPLPNVVNVVLQRREPEGEACTFSASFERHFVVSASRGTARPRHSSEADDGGRHAMTGVTLQPGGASKVVSERLRSVSARSA